MEIVLLGLIVVALIDGIVAAPRDNDNHLVKKLEDSKSEFETILAQLQAQLNDQQQQIQEQQHRMEVQQQRNEEQQRQMEAFMQINRARQSDTETVQARVVELRRELEEVKARQADADLRKEVEEVKARQADMEEIKRHRRGDVEYLAELKTLIQSEIQGNAQCAVGNYSTTLGVLRGFENDFIEVETISYGRTFSRMPAVVTSIAGFERGKIAPGLTGRIHGDEYNIEVTVYAPTEDKFHLHLNVTNVQIKRLEVTWIACA